MLHGIKTVDGQAVTDGYEQPELRSWPWEGFSTWKYLGKYRKLNVQHTVLRAALSIHSGKSSVLFSCILLIARMTVNFRNFCCCCFLTSCGAHLPALSSFHSHTNSCVKFLEFVNHQVLLEEQQALFSAHVGPKTRLPDGPRPGQGVLTLMERDLVFWVLNYVPWEMQHSRCVFVLSSVFVFHI